MLKPDIKEELVDVEDESVYSKLDWVDLFCLAAIAGAITLFIAHFIFMGA